MSEETTHEPARNCTTSRARVINLVHWHHGPLFCARYWDLVKGWSGGWLWSLLNGGMSLLMASKLEQWGTEIAGGAFLSWIWMLSSIRAGKRRKLPACGTHPKTTQVWGLPSCGPVKCPPDHAGCGGLRGEWDYRGDPESYSLTWR